MLYLMSLEYAVIQRTVFMTLLSIKADLKGRKALELVIPFTVFTQMQVFSQVSHQKGEKVILYLHTTTIILNHKY